MDIKAGPQLQLIYEPIRRELGALDDFLSREFAHDDDILDDILQHVARFRGKQLRPALVFLCGRLNGDECSRDHIRIGAVIELIHTATLVHDDVLDAALIRRNLETVHRRWGERAAILIGDFIYSRAFHLSTHVDGMATLLSKTTQTICAGELLQLQSRFQPEMDETHYFEIIHQKTAILYAVACRVGATLAGFGAPDCDRLHRFGNALGMAFQIVDDCLDYSGTEVVAGKSLGSDLRQNKVTLPLIYLLENVSSREAASLRDELARPLSTEVEARIQTMVFEHGIIDQCLDRAEAFVRSAKEELKEIVGRPLRTPPTGGGGAGDVRESLELLGDYVLRRRR